MNRSTRLRGCGAILVAMSMGWPAWAAGVFYVDAKATGAGDGTSWADAYTSVQRALDAAGVGDQVWVAAGRYMENISLRDAVALYGGFAGTESQASFDLADRDFIAHETILDGNQVDSVVTAPQSMTEPGRIDGFTVTNGRFSGISCSASTNPVIANNRIVGNAGYGIDISPHYSSSSPVLILGNTIAFNTTTGIHASTYHSLPSSITIEHNTVTDNAGNGVRVVGPYRSSHDCPIRVGNNIVARNAGTGVYADSFYACSPVTIIDNAIVGNGTGDASYRLGGGIHATHGSGMPAAVFLIKGNTVTGNTAQQGAGIHCVMAGATVISNTIIDNVATGEGGGIFSSGSTIADNILENNQAQLGGGIYVGGGYATGTVTGNVIEGNIADYGSGIYCYGGPHFIAHNTITANGLAQGNSWRYQGAGLHVELSSSTIAHNTITANSRGIECVRADAHITDCIISDHVSSGGSGITTREGNPVIVDCTFSRNTASRSGGGIHIESGNPSIRGCVFIRNAGDYGGGVYIYQGTASLMSCMFHGNTAAYGGGIATMSGTVTMVNCAFTGNKANQGGGIHVSGGSLAVNGCTFSDNVATSTSSLTGGTIHLAFGSAAVVNSILWRSGAVSYVEAHNVTATYSNIKGGAQGEGNMDFDPLFTHSPSAGADGVWATEDDDYGDLRLQPTSPCSDAGNNAAVPAGVTTDLAGQPRFMDNPRVPNGAGGTPPIVDMGAYEYHELIVATPVFDPDSGPINASQQVTITCTTPGAIIHYTTDGRDPTEDDPTVESGESVSVSTESPTTLKAKAWNDGLEPSGVKTAVYWRPVIIFVTLDGDDANDGSSWATAKRTVQAGINAAQTGDWVWVAAGIYTPTGDGDRAKSFAMKPGVTLFGGLAGTEAPTVFTPTDRDLSANETILSGDLLGNDNSQVAHDEPTRQDNSFHVVVGADDATLDGFTVTGGNANGAASAAQLGAGMYNNGCSPSVTGCLFRGNTAVLRGAGMYNCNNSPTVVRCSFTGNSAGDGGGMDNDDHAVPRVVGCLFSRNSATSIVASGGGMRNGQYSDATVTACSFVGNTGIKGGGMYNAENSQATVTHCVFHANRVVGSVAFGGGVVNRTKTKVRFRYCTFVDNVAGGDRGSGGALAVIQAAKDSTSVVNSIFWGNTASYGSQLYRSTEASVAVSCCNIQGGCSGTGNIDADPQFASPWGNYRLRPGSPCIDAGTNTVGLPIGTRDFDGVPRIVDGNGDGTAIADMGAYESAGLPTVVGAVSRKLHGAAGEFDLDLPLDGGQFAFGEGRLGGVSELVVAFSEPVFAADGVADESEVSVSVGVVQNVGLAGDQMTVQLSGVAETTCLTVALAGLVDADGNPLLGSRFSFCVLAGDVNGDGTVDLLDLEQIRDQLNQPVTADSARADVNSDGQVNIFDLVAVRNRLDTTGTCP